MFVKRGLINAICAFFNAGGVLISFVPNHTRHMVTRLI